MSFWKAVGWTRGSPAGLLLPALPASLGAECHGQWHQDSPGLEPPGRKAVTNVLLGALEGSPSAAPDPVLNVFYPCSPQMLFRALCSSGVEQSPLEPKGVRPKESLPQHLGTTLGLGQAEPRTLSALHDVGPLLSVPEPRFLLWLTGSYPNGCEIAPVTFVMV